MKHHPVEALATHFVESGRLDHLPAGRIADPELVGEIRRRTGHQVVDEGALARRRRSQQDEQLLRLKNRF